MGRTLCNYKGHSVVKGYGDQANGVLGNMKGRQGGTAVNSSGGEHDEINISRTVTDMAEPICWVMRRYMICDSVKGFGN